MNSWIERVAVIAMGAAGVFMVWEAYHVRSQAGTLTRAQYCDRQDAWVRHGVVAVSLPLLVWLVVATAADGFDAGALLYVAALYVLLIGPVLMLSLSMCKTLIFHDGDDE